jgi:zinc transporter
MAQLEMSPVVDLSYGSAPGLRFACVLDGRGGARQLDWTQLRDWSREDGVIWIHLERDAPEAQTWLRDESGVDPVIVQSLLADDSRPRVDGGEDSLLVFLRGVNRSAEEDPVDLVPIHIWIHANRVISLRDCNHQLSALRDIREALRNGRGPATPGDLLVRIAAKVIRDVGPVLDELDEEIDRLDEQCEIDMSRDWRSALGELRRRALELRRYLAPQREALGLLLTSEVSWLNRRDYGYLREIADKVLRYVETLDVIRERATLLNDHLTAQTSERIAKTSNRLTALAAVLLPPSLIAGLFGMNVGGLPGSGSSWGFTAVVLGLVGLMIGEVWLLRRMGWI